MSLDYLFGSPADNGPAEPDNSQVDIPSLIETTANKYGVPVELALAMIDQESGGNTNAVSPKQARGLGQLMPATAARFGVTDPHDPVQNVDGSMRYMRALLDEFGSPELAVAGYHAGEGNVRKAGGQIPDTSDGLIRTPQYVANILKKAELIRQQRAESPNRDVPTLDALFGSLPQDNAPQAANSPTAGGFNLLAPIAGTDAIKADIQNRQSAYQRVPTMATKGAASMIEGLGWLVGADGVEKFGRTKREEMEAIQAKDPEMRDALAKYANASGFLDTAKALAQEPLALADMLVGSAIQVAATLPAGAIGGVIGRIGFNVGKTVGMGEEAALALGRATAEKWGAIAGSSAAEGAIAAGQTGSEVQNFLVEKTGMDPARAQEVANEAALKVGLATTVMAGFGSGKLEGELLTGSVKDKGAKGAIRNILGPGVEELGQNTYQEYATVQGKREGDPNQEMDLGKAAASGLIAGAMQAAPMHIAGRMTAKDVIKPVEENPTLPAIDAAQTVDEAIAAFQKGMRTDIHIEGGSSLDTMSKGDQIRKVAGTDAMREFMNNLPADQRQQTLQNLNMAMSADPRVLGSTRDQAIDSVHGMLTQSGTLAAAQDQVSAKALEGTLDEKAAIHAGNQVFGSAEFRQFAANQPDALRGAIDATAAQMTDATLPETVRAEAAKRITDYAKKNGLGQQEEKTTPKGETSKAEENVNAAPTQLAEAQATLQAITATPKWKEHIRSLPEAERTALVEQLSTVSNPKLPASYRNTVAASLVGYADGRGMGIPSVAEGTNSAGIAANPTGEMPAAPGAPSNPQEVLARAQLSPEHGTITLADPRKFDRNNLQAIKHGGITPGQASFLQSLGQALGRQVVFFEQNGNTKSIDGFTVPNAPDVIFLNRKQSGAASHHAILGHELLHTMPDDIKAAFIDAASKVLQPNAAQKLRAYINQEGLDTQGLMEEIGADLFGNGLNRPELIGHVLEQMPVSAAQRLLQYVRQFFQSMIQKFGAMKNFDTGNFVTDIKALDKAWVKAMGDYLARQQSGEGKINGLKAADMANEELSAIVKEKGPQAEQAEAELGRRQSEAGNPASKTDQAKEQAAARKKQKSGELLSPLELEVAQAKTVSEKKKEPKKEPVAAKAETKPKETPAAKESPKATQERHTSIMFEVAPDPNNTALVTRWRDLDHLTKLAISEKVAQAMIPKMLKTVGVKGEMKPQLGGYMGETNPSFSIQLADTATAVQINRVAKMAGYMLSQDSMMAVTRKPMPNSDPVGIITVSLPKDASPQLVADVYKKIYEIDNGALQGHTTVDGEMALIDFSDRTKELAEKVLKKLESEYNVHLDSGYAAFIEKKEYDYGQRKIDNSSSGTQAAAESPIRAAANRLRAEASSRLEKELNGPGTDTSANVDGSNSTGSEEVKASTERKPVGPVFYSALLRAVTDIKNIADKNGMVNPDQAKQWLASRQKEGKFKQEELEWSGLPDMLAAQKGKVSVSDIASFVENNGVQVDEVMKGDSETKAAILAAGDAYARMNVQESIVRSLHARLSGGVYDKAIRDAIEKADKELMRLDIEYTKLNKRAAELVDTQIPSKFDTYQLPGGKNYKELLLTIPTVQDLADIGALENKREAFLELADEVPDKKEKYLAKAAALEEQIKAEKDRTATQKQTGNFVSSHWDGVPNIVAHVRFDERTDADGKKVLFIEELQSDWGQKGKKEGFANPRELAALKAEKKSIEDSRDRSTTDAPRELIERHAMLGDQIDRLERGSSIPPAPFVTDTKSWLGLGLKRMIRYAAENGYDKVAFVNGEQSAARYDLSKRVSKIVVKPYRAERGEYTLDAYDKYGARVLAKDAIQLADMDDYIGKEVADRARKQVQDYGNANLSGLDLKIGGEGMKAFYDKIVPQAANEVLKKVGGGKVGSTTIEIPKGRPTEYDDFNAWKEAPAMTTGEQASFDITPELRDKAMQGMPLFSAPRGLVASAWASPEPSKMDDFIYSLQDKKIDLKRVVQTIRDTGKQIADRWNPYLQEELYHGRTAKQTKDFLDHEMKPLLQSMLASNTPIDDLNEFLQMRHAEERNQQIASINPAMPDGGSGVSTADAKAYLAGLSPDKKRILSGLAGRVDAITKDTRDLLVSSGLETQDTIDQWEQTYKNYVPLMREDVPAGGLGIGQGFSVKGGSTKRAMGSDKPVADILAHVAMMRERTITRAEKNRVGLALMGLAIANPNPDFWLPVMPNTNFNEQRQNLINMGLNPADIQNLIDEPTQRYIDQNTGLVSERINPVLRNAENVIATRFKGEDYFLFMSERDQRATRMAQSMKNLDADQMGKVLTGVAKVTRWFAAVNTQYNPVFGVINVMRDTGSGLLNLTSTPLAGKQAQVMAHAISAMRGIFIDLRDTRAGKTPTSAWSQLWEEFQNEGGQTGYRDMFATSDERANQLKKEIADIQAGKAKQFGKGILNLLTDFNDTMENSIRLASYKVAKEQGMSNEQAASLAKNLTVNFNRKGQVATQAGAMYAFFNASTQGTARIAETLAGPAGKKILAGGMALGVIQAFALAAAGFKDDELPEYIKQRNIVIPIGDKKYLTIPMPLGFNVIPGIARLGTEFIIGGGKNVTKYIGNSFDLMADNLNPIGNAGLSVQTIAPTFADPLVALAENRDWTGKPIAKKDISSLAPTPGFTRAKDTASDVGKAVAYGINWVTGGTDYKPGMLSWTPDQVDYMIGQVTGGVGREALKVNEAARSAATGEELSPNKMPLVGRFYGDTSSQANVAGKFYENLTKLNEHEAEIKGRRKDHGDVIGYISDNPESHLVQAANLAEREVSSLRKLKKALTDKGGSSDRVKSLDQRINGVMNRLNQRVESLQQ